MQTIKMESPVRSNGCSYMIYLTTDKQKYEAAMKMAGYMAKAMDAREQFLHFSCMSAHTYNNELTPVLYDCRVPAIFHGENKYGVIIETINKDRNALQTYEIVLMDD